MENVALYSEEWERLCRGCGLCCFEKYENANGSIFYTQTPCRYLDVVSRECRIYDNRFEINPECMKLTPYLVSTLSWLPRDCGYVDPPQQDAAPVPYKGRRRKRR